VLVIRVREAHHNHNRKTFLISPFEIAIGRHVDLTPAVRRSSLRTPGCTGGEVNGRCGD
jgi:hypothetical protein